MLRGSGELQKMDFGWWGVQCHDEITANTEIDVTGKDLETVKRGT
ncbi:MAG: hypothetical protein U0V70_19110 [Terriglobia bacterium]